MITKIFISLLIFILIVFSAIIISIPAVAILLLTKWNGTTTIFGNAKWGRGTNHPTYPTEGKYWKEFNWLVLRNPVNNLSAQYLAIKQMPYTLAGDVGIGDKTYGGFYAITMGKFWEYYWVKPYNFLGKRCIRARIGWKIYGNSGLAPSVCAVNPWKKYLGA